MINNFNEGDKTEPETKAQESPSVSDKVSESDGEISSDLLNEWILDHDFNVGQIPFGVIVNQFYERG